MKSLYAGEGKLLDEDYNPYQIYVRSTDVNRTIVSAMSHMQGMYPQQAASSALTDAQQAQAIPPFDLSDKVKDIKTDLAEKVLPDNFQPVPIHVFEKHLDKVG